MTQFTAPPLPQAAPAAAAPTAKRGFLKWVAAAAAALLALLAGLITLFLIGYESGPVPFLLGLVAAVLPVPVYVTLVLWLDRYEPEPAWMLATSFFWGALVAVFFAIVINSLGVVVVGSVFGRETAALYGPVVSAPLVEETAKSVALFALFFWRRDEFDGVLDGIIYAAMVGLGFAMTENVKYYSAAVLEQNAVGVFVVRGLFSPFAHPMFTAMTGIGLGLAAQTRGRLTKALAPAAGFVLAIALHAGWNASAVFAARFDSGALVLLTYFFVMMPTFVGVLLVVLLALRHEGRLLRAHLLCDLQRGLLTQEEYERLCSVRGRMSASFGALTRNGVGAWRARAQLNRAASELALLRSRVARGVTSRDGRDAEREALYVQQIYRLRLELDGK
ncbi:MAG TPA: PrsW family intramembrane metalloprotease [Pyrinomonadaceae bacterium]|nr:PrsW family intramembrane metalloprotease [Pyrinomonadaceae bacterium]